MFGNHGLCGLPEEGAHEKSPKCLGWEFRGFVWGRYYFDTFIDKAKKGEIFKGNKILNKNSGKIGFDTFRLKLVESNWTLIPFLHDFDEVLG